MVNFERTLFEASEARRAEQAGVTVESWPDQAAAGFKPKIDIPRDKGARTWDDHFVIQKLRREYEAVLVGDHFDTKSGCPAPCSEMQTVYVKTAEPCV